jgi:hypothetical protein
MLATFRSRALLALTVVSLAACSEETEFLTDLSTEEATADIELTQAAFETPQATSVVELGTEIDAALSGIGGAVVMGSVVAAGPSPDARTAARVVETFEALPAEPVASIPAGALGKTFAWNTTTDQYAQTAAAGAPANGVRFLLYTIDTMTYQPAEPLVQVGTLDITTGGTASRPTGSVVIKNNAGTTVLEYTVTVGGTEAAPSVSVAGAAGTGPNAATFSLTVGVNIVNSTVTATWRTAIPARGLTTRTTLGFSEAGFALNGVMQRGLRRVSIAGNLTFASGGTLTVKVGDRTFATITTDASFNTTVTNAEGGALTPEEEATLELIFEWFSSTFNWLGLLDPLSSVLGVSNPAA